MKATKEKRKEKSLENKDRKEKNSSL